MAAVDAVAAAKVVQELRRVKLAAGSSCVARTVAVVGAAGHGKSAVVGAVMLHGGANGATGRSVLYVDDSRADGLRLIMADTPGHPDLRIDAESTLHMCGAALIVVDCIEGVLSATESLLRAVWAASLPCVLVLNKLDRILQADAALDEVVYSCLAAAASHVQGAASDGGDRGSTSAQASMDACVFASARDGWGFTLHSFAKLYAERFGVDAKKLMGRLWGDSFYDAQTRRWVSRADERLVREKKDFRTAWSGWLLRENTMEMRWQRYYHVLEQDHLSWYTQPSHYDRRDPGPRGMITMDEYELDGTHQLLAEIEQPHTFALLPAGYREREAANDGTHHEGLQPLVVAAENEATLETLKKKWASNLEFLRRRKLRAAGELDDQLPRRAFCQFVLEPLRGVCAAALREQRPRLLTRLKNLRARELTGAELSLRGADLMAAALRAWLPLGDAIVGTVRDNLASANLQPSRCFPRSEMRQSGFMVNQVVPVPPGISLPDGGRFMALGRVFGGPLKVQESLQTTEHEPVNIASLWRWTGSCANPAATAVEIVEEGDVVLVSLDGEPEENLKLCPSMLRGCSTASPDGHRECEVLPTALMWVDVFAAEGQDMTKLQALVHRAVLLTSSGVVFRSIEPVGTLDRDRGFAVGACGELLLHLWITQFQATCDEDGFEASVSEAYVPLRESVAGAGKLVVSASPDRGHWLTMSVTPISSERCEALKVAKAAVSATRSFADVVSDTGVDLQTEPRGQLEEALAHACGSDVATKTRDKRVLLNGPGINILEDKRVGTDVKQAQKFASLLETSDAVAQGLLCSLRMDGVRFTLHQYKNISDSDIAKGGDPPATAAETNTGSSDMQLCLALQRVVYAACISAGPCLIEPLYDVEVVCGSEDDVVDVYRTLSQHGGAISGERQHPSSPTYYIKGRVPVARSFGLTAAIREATTGSATAQCSFRDAWQRVTPPLIGIETVDAVPAGAYSRYVKAARLRQGMDVETKLPSLSTLTDQMSLVESTASHHQDVATSATAEASMENRLADTEPEPEPELELEPNRDMEPEPELELEPEPKASPAGRKRTGKQIKFPKPAPRNVDREPEARAW